MKLKNIFILTLLLVLTLSCNSGDDYLGNWYNKKYNQILFISKAGNKGYLIRLYGGKGFSFTDDSKYFIFEDEYFYLTEEDRKKNKPFLIVQNKNQIISYDGILFTKK
jgi:hypothetical protein